MALPNVNFTLGQGGNAQTAPGQDYISGLVAYMADGSLPSGFSTSNRIRTIFSLPQAEALGITDTHLGETKASGTVAITGAGAAGDTIAVYVAEPFGVSVLLGKYTILSSDTTTTLVATGLRAAINALTSTHGYVASGSTTNVVITARAGLGVFLNSGTPISTVIVGTATRTLTQFSGGVASVIDPIHYHISEFFRMNPTGQLYVGLFAVPGTFDGAEIVTVQTFANNSIRQFGVYYTAAAFSTAQLDALQTKANLLATTYKWTQVIYAGDLSGTADITTITDLSTLSDSYVSTTIAQDGAAVGATLFYATGKSITDLGAKLGAVSRAGVNVSIAYVGGFNFSDGTELDTLAFSNGQLYDAIVTSDPTEGTLNAIDNKRYIFLRKFTGYAGSYANADYTAITATSDYAYISSNRVIQKAQRLLYPAYVANLANPTIRLNPDGSITDVSVATLENVGNQALAPMILDPVELSGFTNTIDPLQRDTNGVPTNLNSTKRLKVVTKLQGLPNIGNIDITIGYTLTL